jgi:hypothetical protein
MDIFIFIFACTLLPFSLIFQREGARIPSASYLMALFSKGKCDNLTAAIFIPKICLEHGSGDAISHHFKLLLDLFFEQIPKMKKGNLKLSL